ncbi:hypothetical protein BN1723_012084, partial [Verticillium longisporum]
MPGRQAHGRPLISAKSAPKPHKKSSQKVRARALDAFGIASEQFPTKEKKTPRFREINADVGRKHSREEDDEDEDDEDDEDEAQSRRKRVKPSAAPAGDDEEDEFGSDSEGNEWRYGVGADDDSELDSDEAFGESDEEEFQGYTFGKSSQKKTKKTKQDDSDDDHPFDDPEDFDAGDDGDDLGEDAIDLAQMLDMAEDESDEEEEEGESDESDSDQDDASSPPSSDEDDEDDEDVDSSKLDALQTFISGYGGEDDKEDAPDGSKPRQKISFKDLGLAGVKDPQMKKSMKLMSKEEKEARPGGAKKLAIPLGKRQQDKLSRAVAYEKTNETLDRWTDRVKQDRRAEHLVFPLPENAQDAGLNHDELAPITSKTTGNELEQTEGLKVEGHGLVENSPAEDDEEGGDEKSDLNAGSDGDAHSQIHLVANGDHNSRDVLSSVSDDGDENKTDEVLADMRLLHNIVNAAHEVVGADGDEDRGHDKDKTGGNGAHGGLLRLLLAKLDLGIEKVGVGAKLEPQVHDVEDKEGDGGAARKHEDAVFLLGAVGLV